jgi:hypothetical protein
MLGLTQAQRKQAFDHLLNEVLDRGDDSHLKSGALLCKGVNDVTSLITIRENVLNNLQYKDPNAENALRNVNGGDKGLIEYVQF